MTEDEVRDLRTVVSLIRAKIDILRNFQIVADQGMRQQQSAANDEIIGTLKDISNQLTRLLRSIEK